MNALLECDENMYSFTYPFFMPEEWILFLDGNCRQSTIIDFAPPDFMCHFH